MLIVDKDREIGGGGGGKKWGGLKSHVGSSWIPATPLPVFYLKIYMPVGQLNINGFQYLDIGKYP